MARRRFYAPPDQIENSFIALSVGETHHLIHVLRMTPGDEAFVFDGCGSEFRCCFRSVKDDRAQLDVLDALTGDVESPVDVTLAHALAKGEKFDFIIQKATELGVSRIAPLMTRYAELRLDDRQVSKRVERWRRISLEALKQCGRRRLVEIGAPLTLREFFGENSRFQADSAVLLFSERGGVALPDALIATAKLRHVVALIGPEGGWSDDEIELLQQLGCKPVTLGPRVLRTETAALAAITLIQHAVGDLSTGGDE